MPDFDDLQPHQYEDLYRESDVPLSDVRGSALRLVVYAVAGAVLLFIILGSIITIPYHLSVPFRLQGSTGEAIYRFPEPLYLQSIDVEVGEEVRAGEKLLAVTSPRIASLVADYERASGELERFLEGELPVQEAKKRSLALRSEGLRLRIEETRREGEFQQKQNSSEIAVLESEALHAAALLRGATEAFREGAAPAVDLRGAEARSTAAAERLRSARLRLREERAAAASREERLEVERREVEEEIGGIDLETARRRAELQGAADDARNAIALNFGPFQLDGSALILKADRDGVVTFLFDGDKELPAGSILLKISPGRSDLRARASIPSDRIGLVRKGEEAVLKVSTFPHYRWGVVRGRVASVSLTPSEAGEYPVEVALEEFGGLRDRIAPGMTGELSIVVEERSLFAILLDRLRRSYHELAG